MDKFTFLWPLPLFHFLSPVQPVSLVHARQALALEYLHWIFSWPGPVSTDILISKFSPPSNCSNTTFSMKTHNPHLFRSLNCMHEYFFFHSIYIIYIFITFLYYSFLPFCIVCEFHKVRDLCYCLSMHPKCLVPYLTYCGHPRISWMNELEEFLWSRVGDPQNVPLSPAICWNYKVKQGLQCWEHTPVGRLQDKSSPDTLWLVFSGDLRSNWTCSFLEYATSFQKAAISYTAKPEFLRFKTILEKSDCGLHLKKNCFYVFLPCGKKM